nr:class I SAM-dependent methyltransferase [Planctomycetota bacterium]
MRELTVSRATAGFLRRGHPWVRPDRFTRGLERLTAGEAVTLVDEKGQGLASALADPEAEICARVYHKQPGKGFDPAAAIARAWERRAALHADPGTTCYRVVHGEGDFLPGLRVERYADVLVMLVRTAAMAAHAKALAAALHAQCPAARIVIREQLDDLRRRDISNRSFDGSTIDPDEQVLGHEFGVAVHCTPFAGLATGVYVDQRATRHALRQGCAGARVLNLFAYTGLFSCSLLAAGAASATDVDLSAPALELAARNASHNGFNQRYQQHHGEVRAFLERDTTTYDLIICDPPTAAQGAGGWLVRRDYPAVLKALAPRLAPGGRLVAIANTLGKRFDLARAVREQLPQAEHLP